MNIEQQFASLYDTNWIRESHEIPIFWKRLGHSDLVRGKTILDFGSGLGCMSVDLIRKGAKAVHGIEIEDQYKRYAETKFRMEFADIKDRVKFSSCKLDQLEDNYYDVIVSKDVFEHVIGLEEIFPVLIRKLKPGGHLLLGFGPQWHSAFGDHGISKKMIGFKIPWLHLFLSDRSILKFLEKKKLNNEQVASFSDAGFNRLTNDEFRKIIYSLEDLHIQSYAVNISNSPLATFSNLFLKLVNTQTTRKYLTSTIYCVAQKNNNNT